VSVARVPAWVDGELPEPDGIGCTLYLDNADRIEPHREVLQLWYDTVAEIVLPEALSVCLPAGSPRPRARFRASPESAGIAPRARVRRWSGGLTEDLYQLQAHWSMEVDEPYMDYHVGLYAFRFQPRHVKLQTAATAPAGSAAGVLAAMVELAVRLGNATDLAYGQITFNDHGPGFCYTRLDFALHRDPYKSADESRTVLRGYEWITILPSQLLRAAGGADALRSSGAFVDVVELTHGALLRATNTPYEFTTTRATAVWEAVRPILPPPTGHSRL
jgi:hypothetical protein